MLPAVDGVLVIIAFKLAALFSVLSTIKQVCRSKKLMKLYFSLPVHWLSKFFLNFFSQILLTGVLKMVTFYLFSKAKRKNMNQATVNEKKNTHTHKKAQIPAWTACKAKVVIRPGQNVIH